MATTPIARLTGAYGEFEWGHRNPLMNAEFYNAPVNGTATLARTVAYTHDDCTNRINKRLIRRSSQWVVKLLTGSTEVADSDYRWMSGR
jgi:predicted alpha-1,6-mannanase (GH76 family)